MPWYLVFEDDNGNPCQRGPYASHGRAEMKKDALDRDGTLYKLLTWDPGEATRILKEKRIDELGVTKGSKNFKHKNFIGREFNET